MLKSWLPPLAYSSRGSLIYGGKIYGVLERKTAHEDVNLATNNTFLLVITAIYKDAGS